MKFIITFLDSEFSNFDEKKHQKRNEKFNKRNVKCYNCNKFGHFVADCWSDKERKGGEANIARGESDDEHVLLMASESKGEKNGRLVVHGHWLLKSPNWK